MSIEELQKRREELRKKLGEVKEIREKFNEKSKQLKEKRQELAAQIKKYKQEGLHHKEQRDETNIRVANSKKRRRELNKEYNKELDTIEVDESELKKFLDDSFKDKKDFILDGHLAHLLSSNFVDLCLVLRCDNSVLYQRLTARGYSKDKIKDNLESEIFNQCYEDAKARNHKILTIDTSNFKDEDFSLLSDFIKANL